MANDSPPHVDRILSLAFSRFPLFSFFIVLYVEAADLLQNLSFDTQAQATATHEPNQKTDVYQYGGGVDLHGQAPSFAPNPYRPLYFGGGYGAEYTAYPQGVDMNTGTYSENGSLVYPRGYGYSAYPYSPATSPVPQVGSDGQQLYGAQQYQYPSYYPTVATQGDLSANKAGGIKTLPAERNDVVSAAGTAKGNSGWGPNNVRTSSHLYGNGASGGGYAAGYQDPRYSYDGYYGPVSKLYAQYGSTGGSGTSYGSSGYDSRTNGRGWTSTRENRYRSYGGRGSNYFYGNENNDDGMNELNRGPRGKGTKIQKEYSEDSLEVKERTSVSNVAEAVEMENTCIVPDREQYNKEDFPVDYANAMFFIIKSYSEDDVHKSIKYNVWASTPNGNKKLAAAYEEAQQKPTGCPIFLFFSVNASGQFVGLAEMTGPIDFNTNVECWQQDKWTGSFPLKWHIVKDVPNRFLKHITLENNENKPVTNSRDTQEVKLEQGLKIVKIFKEHSSKSCVLDDFSFYEVSEEKATTDERKESAACDESEPATNKESPPAVETTGDDNKVGEDDECVAKPVGVVSNDC
ncbi:unnamed protein product [Cochlearia groenlandica]